MGKINISGTKNKHNKSSCRNALSSLIAKLNPDVAYLTHLSPESDHDVVTKLCPPNTYPAYDGLVINI